MEAGAQKSWPRAKPPKRRRIRETACRISQRGGSAPIPRHVAAAVARSARGGIRRSNERLRINPDHVDAQNIVWHGSNWRSAAISTAPSMNIKRSSRCGPELPEAYSNLAVAQKRKGDFTGAVASLNRALELRPDFSAALTTRGGIFAEQNQWAEARARFRAGAQAQSARRWRALWSCRKRCAKRKITLEPSRVLGELISRSPNFVYWLEWGRIGLIRYWWVLLSLAIAVALRGRFKKVRTVVNG